MHALSDGQSESEMQPTGTTASIGLHVPLPLLTYPSGHTQIIVRTGSDGTTSHFAGCMHGSSAVHGFTHSLLIHATRDGQSGSTVH